MSQQAQTQSNGDAYPTPATTYPDTQHSHMNRGDGDGATSAAGYHEVLQHVVISNIDGTGLFSTSAVPTTATIPTNDGITTGIASASASAMTTDEIDHYTSELLNDMNDTSTTTQWSTPSVGMNMNVSEGACVSGDINTHQTTAKLPCWMRIETVIEKYWIYSLNLVYWKKMKM